jgi:small subunit ribosomal protein S1
MVRHNYPVGARVRGKVRNMTTYGAFIELEEGIDGMVHVSDMSWTRKINHPSEML